MKERPILFSAPMVRAILEGRKTQTRRVMRSQPYTLRTEGFGYPTKAGGFVSLQSPHCFAECPYGAPGDRLWVKETWWQIPEPSLSDLRDGADTWPEPIGPQEQRVAYAADGDDADVVRRWGWKLRPSIFMPRWASRITLEITDVRVQRVQEISTPDAIAEGIEPVVQMGAYQTFKNYGPLPSAHMLPVDSFQSLWDSINGKTHPWANNDWVWAVSFRRAA